MWRRYARWCEGPPTVGQGGGLWDIKGLRRRVKGVLGGWGDEGVMAEVVDGIVATVRAVEGGAVQGSKPTHFTAQLHLAH